MSDESKKALLNEATTKRFWKLAGLRPIHEKAYVFDEGEEYIWGPNGEYVPLP